MGAVDDYLEALDDDVREVYARIRDLAVAEVPDAEQGISYGMAALRYRGKPLLGFKAARGHLSVFPFSPAVVESVAASLDGFSVSKGTIRFSVVHALPDGVVRDLVRARAAEISGD
jgi:uncharacterized protein YdhG (YjbR/CyaY superfamily)